MCPEELELPIARIKAGQEILSRDMYNSSDLVRQCYTYFSYCVPG